MRDSTLTSRIGTFLFGIVFAGAGALTFALAIAGASEGTGGGENVWVAYLVGILFTLVGLGVALSVFWTSGPSAMKTPMFDPSRRWGRGHWPWFPAARLLKGGGPGGEICLAPEQGRLQITVFLFLFGGVWTGIISAIMVHEIRDAGLYSVGVAFMGLFVLVGLVILGAGVYSLLGVIMLGPTLVMVDRECVAPGDRVRFRIQQRGVPRINKASVRLVCREWVTYQRGKHRHEKSHEIHGEEVVSVGETMLGPDGLVTRGEFRIPQGAMHSFRSENNQIIWELELKVDIPMRPDVATRHQIRVEPAS